MIIYTYDKGHYITVAEHIEKYPEGKRSMYINLTNRCTCACTFCLRNLKEEAEDKELWLKEEPSVEAVKKALDEQPWDYINEVVFCGFGEPTMRLRDVVTLLTYIKANHKDVKTRMNTNGLSILHMDETRRRILPVLFSILFLSALTHLMPNAIWL